MQRHGFCLTAEHLECLLCISCDQFFRNLCCFTDWLAQLCDLLHTIYPIADNLFMGIAVAHEIIVVFHEHKRNRINNVFFLPFPVDPLVVFVKIEIHERNLALLNQCFLNVIYIVENRLIGMFPRVEVDKVALHDTGSVASSKVGDLFDQLLRFLLGNEAGRLNCINKDFQLAEAELPVIHVVAFLLAYDSFHHFITIVLQHLNILRYRSAIAGNAFFFEAGDNLICSKRMEAI